MAFVHPRKGGLKLARIGRRAEQRSLGSSCRQLLTDAGERIRIGGKLQRLRFVFLGSTGGKIGYTGSRHQTCRDAREKLAPRHRQHRQASP